MKEAFFDCSCLFEETRWHHLVIVIHRNVMRGATASLYIDGAVVDTQKVGRVFSVVTSLLWSPSFLSPPPVLSVFLVITHPCCHFSSVVYLVSLLWIWWCFHCFCHAKSLCHTLLHPALSRLAITPLVIVTPTVTPPALSLLIHCHSFSHCHPTVTPPFAQVTYIQPIVSTSSVGARDAAVPHIVSVNGIIGTRWSRRHILPIVYHLGPTYLFEETVSPQGIEHITRLGPNYMGCLQAPVIKDYVSV